MRKYIEFGFGNTWLVRTEFENEDGSEYELKGIVGKINPESIYVRCWIGKTVYILDWKDGVKRINKNRMSLKFLFSIRSKN